MAFGERESFQCERLIRWGLDEDLDRAGDITSLSVIDADRFTRARVVVRDDGVVAGLESLPILARIHDQGLNVELLTVDGPVTKGEVIARLSGPTRTVLAVERTLLNFLSRLSGVATLTARYVSAVNGTKAKICDTQKRPPDGGIWKSMPSESAVELITGLACSMES